MNSKYNIGCLMSGDNFRKKDFIVYKNEKGQAFRPVLFIRAKKDDYRCSGPM